MCTLPSSCSRNFISETLYIRNVYIFVIGNIQSLTSNFWSRRSLGRKRNQFLVPWDLTSKDILITRLQESNSTLPEY